MRRGKAPQDKRSETTVTWRPRPSVAVLIEQAAVLRGWPVNKLLEEAAIPFALEICSDALRGLAKIRAANRRERARKGGLARHKK
jgi:hypothetical protein